MVARDGAHGGLKTDDMVVGPTSSVPTQPLAPLPAAASALRPPPSDALVAPRVVFATPPPAAVTVGTTHVHLAVDGPTRTASPCVCLQGKPGSAVGGGTGVGCGWRAGGSERISRDRGTGPCHPATDGVQISPARAVAAAAVEAGARRQWAASGSPPSTAARCSPTAVAVLGGASASSRRSTTTRATTRCAWRRSVPSSGAPSAPTGTAATRSASCSSCASTT